MKAVRFQEPKGFEGIDGLVYEDAPDPQPAIGDALVQVRAASFTPTELLWPLSTDRAGHDRGRRIPAHEGSGIVVALGFGAAGVSVGDEVYGLIDGYRDGWAADYVAIEVRSLAPKPTTVDFVEAAAIPQAALTSWQALFDHGHLESGQTVVDSRRRRRGRVDGGAARPLGRRARHRNRSSQRARNTCSTWAPTNSSTSSRMAGRPPSARSTWSTTSSAATCSRVRRRSSSPVARSSRSWAPPPTDRSDIRTVGFVRDANGAQLREIARLVDDGTLRPDVSAVFPMADAREAFMAKSTKHIPGKVVLTP